MIYKIKSKSSLAVLLICNLSLLRCLKPMLLLSMKSYPLHKHKFCSSVLITPYNVGSVLWRLFSTLEVVQYIGGITSVLWGDSFSTVEVVQYSGGSFSTVEVVQYSGGITSVHAGDNISTVGDNISTVEGIQYCGGIPSVLWGITAVYVGG